jgi:uncharacterized cupin superfamily protein
MDHACCRVSRRGDTLGLTKVGINRTTLLPGKKSSMCHWHTYEDEFIYILEGEVLVRGFSGGARGRHLEVSNRDAEDSAYYTDSDVDLTWSPPHARGRYTRRDGMPF